MTATNIFFQAKANCPMFVGQVRSMMKISAEIFAIDASNKYGAALSIMSQIFQGYIGEVYRH
jgi:hypothetical protein